jgi:light-regulated signal transduction histidine kinase (bacteriophytochrome)
MNGPFGGPRPFAGASMNVRFTFSQNIEETDVEIEQRLRRNGFTRADVEMESSKTDSRTQVRVITSEELFTYSEVRRLVEQVKAEVSQDIPDSRIDVFCT